MEVKPEQQLKNFGKHNKKRGLFYHLFLFFHIVFSIYLTVCHFVNCLDFAECLLKISISAIALLFVVPYCIARIFSEQKPLKNGSLSLITSYANKSLLLILTFAFDAASLNFVDNGTFSFLIFDFIYLAGFAVLFVSDIIFNKINNKLLLFLFSLLFLFFMTLYIFVITPLVLVFLKNDIPQDNPLKYPSILEKLSDYKYRTEHFPSKIPNGAKDYYFYKDFEFDGYLVHYLKFKINKQYADSIIDENKNNIGKKIKCENVKNFYKFIPVDKIESQTGCISYIMNNKNNDEHYTSGIITSESGEIVFFYANFNLSI